MPGIWGHTPSTHLFQLCWGGKVSHPHPSLGMCALISFWFSVPGGFLKPWKDSQVLIWTAPRCKGAVLRQWKRRVGWLMHPIPVLLKDNPEVLSTGFLELWYHWALFEPQANSTVTHSSSSVLFPLFHIPASAVICTQLVSGKSSLDTSESGPYVTSRSYSLGYPKGPLGIWISKATSIFAWESYLVWQTEKDVFLLNFFFCHSLQDLSSLNRNETQASCSGSSES